MPSLYFRILNQKTQQWENKPLESLTPDQINIVMADKGKEFLIGIIRYLVEAKRRDMGQFRDIDPNQIDTGTFDGFGHISDADPGL